MSKLRLFCLIAAASFFGVFCSELLCRSTAFRDGAGHFLAVVASSPLRTAKVFTRKIWTTRTFSQRPILSSWKTFAAWRGMSRWMRRKSIENYFCYARSLAMKRRFSEVFIPTVFLSRPCVRESWINFVRSMAGEADRCGKGGNRKGMPGFL